MTELKDRLRDLAAMPEAPVDGLTLAASARSRAARTRRRAAVASAVAVVAALFVGGALLTSDEPEPPQPATPSPAPTTRQELCSARADLPVLDEVPVGFDDAGALTTVLSAIALCPSDPDHPVWDELADTLVTGERVFLVRFDFGGPPIESCDDALPAAPPFGLVGVRGDDGTAWRLDVPEGCRRWHQISSYFTALAQEALDTERNSDAAQQCSPMSLERGFAPGDPLTGTYAEVTLCVHPWLSGLVEQMPAYRPVSAFALEGTELKTVVSELSQGDRSEPRPLRECPYRSALLEIRASRSSDQEDIRHVMCVSLNYDENGDEVVYWPVFPPATQAILERVLQEAGTAGQATPRS